MSDCPQNISEARRVTAFSWIAEVDGNMNFFEKKKITKIIVYSSSGEV